MPIATLVNVLAVIIGSLVGLTLRRGLPQRFREIIFQGIGLATIILGVLNAWKVTETPDPAVSMIIVIFSMLLGGLLGELMNIEQALERWGDWLKARVKNKDTRFTEGLVTAFLIFCIGPLTLVGSLNEGISGDRSLLLTKSVLDGFMSIALVSTFGIGVLFSVIPLFIFQAGITLLGVLAGDVLPDSVIMMLTAVGGLLILGIGINILGLAKLRLANLLPALVVVVAITLVAELLNNAM